MKKAELSMNMIIIIALGLLILIVVAFVFMKNIDNQGKGSSCISVGGICKERPCGDGIQYVEPLDPKCQNSLHVCCPAVVINP